MNDLQRHLADKIATGRIAQLVERLEAGADDSNQELGPCPRNPDVVEALAILLMISQVLVTAPTPLVVLKAITAVSGIVIAVCGPLAAIAAGVAYAIGKLMGV